MLIFFFQMFRQLSQLHSEMSHLFSIQSRGLCSVDQRSFLLSYLTLMILATSLYFFVFFCHVGSSSLTRD